MKEETGKGGGELQELKLTLCTQVSMAFSFLSTGKLLV